MTHPQLYSLDGSSVTHTHPNLALEDADRDAPLAVVTVWTTSDGRRYRPSGRHLYRRGEQGGWEREGL